ncbi:MAG: Na+/Ca+ antiporter, CaCA family [Candidatus Woesebacteria bacterium GW2011_GWC2_45_9]|uniref:Na+/Ca+ antiporter, CaCA family n=2 Tax=Microgenomates group TaxID=1794810 RepID=A0A0G1NAC6_9BACT|nr:MAG: K+-dependent Na+/Ca+ exchanger related-protein [Candidatus Curtissbacteria bacterium GW2011_GWC1_44_33]KKU17519.1 MAG: Na+/Ca+ antiporter, CaCA family [Candidatus Woesebacteria bacterium GW2011_GWC2_45_9]
MVLGLIVAIYVLSFVLIKSADQVVIALRHLTKSSGPKGAFIISALLLALATSFPELFVAITSALEGSPSLSLGNVLGANIANISLVVGAAGLLMGRVNVHGEFLKRDVWIALVAGVLPIVLVFDGELSRVDGLILLSLYGAYASSFFKNRFLEIGNEIREGTFINRFFRRVNNIDGNKTKEAARLFLGIAVLLVSANLIVNTAQTLAVAANIPVFLIGLILLSIGTTLPELGFSIKSLQNKEPTMFFGNLLGSIIANSTLVIGVAAAIYPIRVAAIEEYLIAAITFVVVFLLFWLFIRSKLKLERWEAGVLLTIYVVFVVVEFL